MYFFCFFWKNSPERVFWTKDLKFFLEPLVDIIYHCTKQISNPRKKIQFFGAQKFSSHFGSLNRFSNFTSEKSGSVRKPGEVKELLPYRIELILTASQRASKSLLMTGRTKRMGNGKFSSSFLRPFSFTNTVKKWGSRGPQKLVSWNSCNFSYIFPINYIY